MPFKISNHYSSPFGEKELQKIAKRIADNKKLFVVVENEKAAKQLVQELQMNGYKSTFEKTDKCYNVYYYEEPNEIEETVADKEYQAFNKEKKQTKYNFDEGSIWVVKEDKHGKPIIVKEVKGNNENNVIRQGKTASVVEYNKDTKLLSIIAQKAYNIDKELTEKQMNEVCHLVINRIDNLVKQAIAMQNH